MKIATRFSPLSGYPTSLLGGNLTIDSAEKGRGLLQAVRGFLGQPMEMGIYSTEKTPLAGKGVDFIVMTKAGIVVTIDATDHCRKMVSRSAQVFVSQSDADAGFALAAKQIAEIIQLNASYIPGMAVPMTSLIRLAA